MQTAPSTEIFAQEDALVVPTNGDTAVIEPVLLPSEPIVNVENPVTFRSLSDKITVEVVLYIAVGLAALLLRIVNVQARPLTPMEAQTAAAAWEFLNGQIVTTYTSPFLFTLNWLTFFLFGASDLSARLVPAALSTLLVFIPLLARAALGRKGTFFAALLITFSPTLVFFGRSLAGADLAVGGALAALILFWQYRATGNTRALYFASALAALSLTADATAFTVLLAGGIYLTIEWATQKRAGQANERVQENSGGLLHLPLVRAAILFAATYLLSATTFLLNRDGLGVAFNLLGEWFGALSVIGNFVSPLNWLLAYEPLLLIFGIAAIALVVTLRGERPKNVELLRLVSAIAIVSFFWYTLVGNLAPFSIVTITLPLAILTGWFVGTLLDRAQNDIQTSGGWRTMLSGEVPVCVMFMTLAALVYLQVATFLQQSQFSSALDALYDLLNLNAAQASLPAAALTILIITVLLLGIFIGLSILLIGIARTATLLALTILVLLSFGMLRATWLLNFSTAEPLREILAPTQTPLQVRDLVRDLEFYSEARNGDPHIIQIAASPELGAVGRWYLRAFQNVQWTNNLSALGNAQAILTSASSPPPGNWMGQQYRIGTQWELGDANGMALWKWFIFRQGGADSSQDTRLWLPTEQE